jgi:hypothetical protein
MLGLGGARDGASQHDRFTRGVDADAFLAGQQRGELALQRRGVYRHRDIDHRHGATCAPQHHVGRAEALAQQVELARARHRHIHHRRVADGQPLHWRGQPQHGGLAHRERQRRGDLGGGGLGGRPLGRHCGDL